MNQISKLLNDLGQLYQVTIADLFPRTVEDNSPGVEDYTENLSGELDFTGVPKNLQKISSLCYFVTTHRNSFPEELVATCDIAFRNFIVLDLIVPIPITDVDLSKHSVKYLFCKYSKDAIAELNTIKTLAYAREKAAVAMAIRDIRRQLECSH